jgi:hypothetical protein
MVKHWVHGFPIGFRAKHDRNKFLFLTIVGAKHSGSPFNIFSNNLSTGMLRPYCGHASPLQLN